MKSLALLFTFLLVFCLPLAARAQAVHVPLSQASDAYALINEVNALRAASGLPPYGINPILMTMAQQHAEFMSVNGVSHYGYGGTRPYQRALNAGYPLAGDLSQGGFFSENITAGTNKTAAQAVLEWQGDAPHLNTMLSPNLMEIGAGVAVVNGYVYYVIDCGRPTGAVVLTPIPTLPGGTPGPTPTVLYAPPLVSTVFPNTPQADGQLYHVVKGGETLWLIAITYGVKVAEIRQRNGMSETEAIYPGEKLLIRADAPTATLEAPIPTETDAPQPSATASPTALPTFTSLAATETLTPTPASEAPLAPPADNTIWLVGWLIALVGLGVALVLAFSGRDSPKT